MSKAVKKQFSVRVVNHSTQLPISRDLMARFDAQFFDGFVSAYVDALVVEPEVYLVNEQELDKYRRYSTLSPRAEGGGLGMDLFGVYISHHPIYHRPCILVSPEKIAEFCIENEGAASFGEIGIHDAYCTLLFAVICHEMAHSIMDRHRGRYFPMSGSFGWRDLLHGALGSIELASQRAFMLTALRKNRCELCRRSSKGVSDVDSFYIEESLANGLALRQRFGVRERKFLVNIMSTQPTGYDSGMQWTSAPNALLSTAMSWKDSKSHWVDAPLTDPLWPGARRPLSELVRKLKSGKRLRVEVDFSNTYFGK